MSIPAAKTLQERESQNAQLKRSNRYTMIGLWIAGSGLFLNALVEVVANNLSPFSFIGLW
jgi:hypothetical protein